MEEDSVFRAEADSFLAKMPVGLQDRQTDAIRKAMAGDGRELVAVRASRNASLAKIEDVDVMDVAPNLRLYAPKERGCRSLPILVYLHGGGWTFGSINSCARFCQTLAATGNVMVLAVDYRLAPEHPFPQGLEDCMRAVEAARKNAMEWGSLPELVSVGGDSSGGNLAVSVALGFLREGSLPVRSLLLFYPVVSAWNDDTLSWRTFQKGFALDGSLMEAFNEAYAGGQERNPLVSPSLCADSLLARLPATLLVAAERDILCSQGEDFVKRLQGLGVDAQRRVLPGTVHLFITVHGQEAAFRKAVSLADGFLSN